MQIRNIPPNDEKNDKGLKKDLEQDSKIALSVPFAPKGFVPDNPEVNKNTNNNNNNNRDLNYPDSNEDNSSHSINDSAVNIADVPLDVLMKILSYLPYRDWIAFITDNKMYSSIKNNPSWKLYWENEVKLHFPHRYFVLQKKVKDSVEVDWHKEFNAAHLSEYSKLTEVEKKLFYFTKQNNVEAIKRLKLKNIVSYFVDYKYSPFDSQRVSLICWAGKVKAQKILDYIYREIKYDDTENQLKWMTDCNQLNLIKEHFKTNTNIPSQALLNHLLTMAARKGHLDMVNFLIDNGAKVNGTDENNYRTPLYGAADLGHADIVQLLLARGATIDLCTKKRAPALIRAAYRGHCETVEVLLKNGANVNGVAYGNSSLHHAASLGNNEMVTLLLDYKADLEIKDENGSTPLMVAIVNERIDTVELLLKRGARIDGVVGKNKSVFDLIKDSKIRTLLVEAIVAQRYPAVIKNISDANNNNVEENEIPKTQQKKYDVPALINQQLPDILRAIITNLKLNQQTRDEKNFLYRYKIKNTYLASLRTVLAKELILKLEKLLEEISTIIQAKGFPYKIPSYDDYFNCANKIYKTESEVIELIQDTYTRNQALTKENGGIFDKRGHLAEILQSALQDINAYKSSPESSTKKNSKS